MHRLWSAAMRFIEPLPSGCPPATAEVIGPERTVFRLVKAAPPNWDDFKSLRALRPNDEFTFSECQARGLSVFEARADCARLAKLPKMRGWAICTVRLHDGSGSILKTGQRTHHTWWPAASYDILANSQAEAAA